MRVLTPDLLHATLCFLGNRPVEEIDLLGAQLTRCTAVADELSIGAPLWLPRRGPRALAVELHDPRGWLAGLQRNVLDAIREVSGWQASEKGRARRRFHPHITLARMRTGAAPRERALIPTPSLSFVPNELVLYRSWLAPEGASHEAVASCPIG